MPLLSRTGRPRLRGGRDPVADNQHIFLPGHTSAKLRGCDELVDLANAAQEVSSSPTAAIGRRARQSDQRHGTASGIARRRGICSGGLRKMRRNSSAVRPKSRRASRSSSNSRPLHASPRKCSYSSGSHSGRASTVVAIGCACLLVRSSIACSWGLSGGPGCASGGPGCVQPGTLDRGRHVQVVEPPRHGTPIHHAIADQRAV